MRLKGKRTLVTGAGSGFGAEIARVYAAEGARVGVLDVNAGAARATADAIGPAALALEADVTDGAALAGAVARAAEAFGGLDVIVNNAGWTHRNKPMLEVDEAEFDRVYATNVKAIFHMAHAVVPLLRRQGTGGVILTVGSTAGVRPRPGLTWYNGSKAAANLLAKSMAVELAPDGIRVNAIAPVMGETGLLEAFMGAPDTPDTRARFEASIPLGRLSRPADVAAAALWLASDEAEFVSGVVLKVDGARCV